MSTKLTIEVVPCGAKLELEHNLLLASTWTDLNNSPNLIVGTGHVDSSDPTRLICNTGIDGNPPVVTLIGANWECQPDATGDATCDLCDNNTPNKQKWTVTKRV